MQKEGLIIIYAYKANCLFKTSIYLLEGVKVGKAVMYIFSYMSSLSSITSNEQSGLNISLKIFSALKEATLVLNQVCLNKLQSIQ